VLVRARAGRLTLTTLRFHDEVRAATETEKEPAPVPDLMAALEQTLAEIKG